MTDIRDSVIRTFVPLLVGWLLAMAARYGFDIDRATLTTVVQAAITFLYYTVVRVLETLRPKAGVLLGVPRAPTYPRNT